LPVPSDQINPDTLMSVVFRDAPIGILLTDIDGKVLESNGQSYALLGYTASEFVSLTFADFTHPDDLDASRKELGLLRGGVQETSKAEMRMITKSGAVVWVRRVASLMESDDGQSQYLVVQIEDISGEREVRDQLSMMAYHDLLTGLGNRATFVANGEHLLSQGPLAVLLIDIDNFKRVNDSLGHSAGDEVLVEFARRLLACAGPDDVVVRLGGDEFVILTVETDPAALERLSQCVLDAGTGPFQVGGVPVVLGVSVGVALAEAGGQAGEMLHRADLSLYSAKRAGKGRSVVFDDRYHGDPATALLLEDALRTAIDAGSLRVEYQPIYRIADESLVGFEALCRWSDPERGVIPPDQFIPIAEWTGLIHELGTLVLRRACTEIASLSQRHRRLSVAVNVSVHQLSRPDFVSIVRDALTESGLTPALLTLEITESALGAPGCLDPVLVELRSLGVGLAIDDFGTGYSSLNRLCSSTFQTLKIDSSFVSEIEHLTSAGALTAAAIALGHSLGAAIIAEGVETVVQFQRLQDLGCEYAQGFLLSRPLPFDAARQLTGAVPASAAIIAAGHPQWREQDAAGDRALIRTSSASRRHGGDPAPPT
jgi:diguanylate cyclase (GGDEF)-like protein/PAS domain S-box-containing protein